MNKFFARTRGGQGSAIRQFGISSGQREILHSAMYEERFLALG